MSLFDSITGIQSSTIKAYTNPKTDETDNEEFDYSGVDYCIGDDFDGDTNLFTFNDDYKSEYEAYPEDDTDYFDFNS